MNMMNSIKRYFRYTLRALNHRQIYARSFHLNQRWLSRRLSVVSKPLFLLLILALLTSCTTEVTLTLQKDDSVDISFEGGAGKAFVKMISSVTGSDEMLIEGDSVSYELAKAGFSSVKVNQKNGGFVTITMKDNKQASYLFSSKILKAEKGKLSTNISRKSLEDFYEAADEQTRMILDLFLAPVFNKEEMSESEYLEMLAAFYGDGAADEIGQSLVKINLISKDGSMESLKYPLTQIFCGLF